MTQILRCDGCETGYDVSKREPGKKVRCPRCKTVLVVPEPDEEHEEHVTQSGRLRKTRGPVCAKHQRTVARGRCATCAQPMCRDCQAPAPIDHLCKSCARTRNLDGALKIDFGVAATYQLAASSFFPRLGRILLWSLAAFLAALVACAVPGYVGGWLYKTYGQAWQGTLGAGVLLGALLTYWTLNNFLLLPAGCAVLVDQKIRGRESELLDAVTETGERVLRAVTQLFLIFLVYLLISVLFGLPTLAITFGLGAAISPDLAALLIVAGISLGYLFIATSLGLAVPVCILEERTAYDSLGRAWELAQQRFAHLAGILFLYYLVSGLIVTPFAAANWWLEAAVLGQLCALFFPALLVAAYHGLAAEHAGILGRHDNV